MDQSNQLMEAIFDILDQRLGERIDEYAFPPPVFTAMAGQFLHLNIDSGLLSAKFPIERSLLNPYGSMQGGMITAAVDNTIGPLSVMVAPPNVTRKMEIIFSKPARFEMRHIIVLARFKGRKGRHLAFDAEVRSPDSVKLARAKATHWIID